MNTNAPARTDLEDVRWMVNDARGRIVDGKERLIEALGLLPLPKDLDQLSIALEAVEERIGNILRDMVAIIDLAIEPAYTHEDVIDARMGEMDEVA